MAKGDDRASSQLSGWKIESDGMRESSGFNGPSCQAISECPSINAAFAYPADSLPLGSSQGGSEIELPEYSLKIVPPSEMHSSAKEMMSSVKDMVSAQEMMSSVKDMVSAQEMISMRMVEESQPSCSLVDSEREKTQSNANSCAYLCSRRANEPKSELKVGSCTHSALRSKHTLASLPTNKENREEEAP